MNALFKYCCLSIITGVIVILATGCGITGNKRLHPGYADFEFPGLLDSDRVMAISLGPLPLKLAAWVVEKEEEQPEVAEMLRELKGVRVYIYELERRQDRTLEKIHRAADRLADKGWSRMIKVNDDSEQVQVLVRMEQDDIAGMAVLSSEGDEAVFVNLIGRIRPEMFNQVIAGLGTDVDVNIPEGEYQLASAE